MAIAAVTTKQISPNAILATWASMANGDTGVGVDLQDYATVTFGVTGTLGAGGSATIEGSNDGGTNFVALTNQAGTTIAKTALGMAAVAEQPGMVRPHVTAGDGTTALICTATLRRVTR